MIQEIAYVTDQTYAAPYENMHQNKHEVTIMPDTLAHEIFQTATVFVPKGNHQAVNKEVAQQLPHVVISGVSTKDGLTEMIELDRSVHPFRFAMQGHPEVDSTLYPLLFQRLALEAQKFAEGIASQNPA